MSTKKERFAKHVAAVDSFIQHQMPHKSEAERQAFREKIIRQYDDTFERKIEAFKQALEAIK